MKTTYLALLLGTLAITSCSKDGGNKNIIKSETNTTTQPKVDKALVPGDNSYTYRGLEGVRAKVSFNNTDKDNTVTIQANNNRFQLDKKSESNGEIHYERAGVSAVAKGDSLILTQNGNVIPLAWDN
ncbi:MAG: hypothetical protein JST62_11525 [Bacteroidetes bacterium]|jgi:hypothetical protein|nr:hypothetical protein [Bacteroidota bacterium]